MKTVTISIGDKMFTDSTEAFKFFEPIPLIDDPAFVPDPKDKDKKPDKVKAYPEEEHIKQCFIKHVLKQEARYRQRAGIDAVKYEEKTSIDNDKLRYSQNSTNL